MVGINLFVVADELLSMVDKEAKDVEGSEINRDRLVGQALYGVQLSMKNVIEQIKLISKIEKEYP